tara:strand:- start:515 stop:766 length:252 start_codon:yes stop_codon:yes gene_type:complete
MNAPNNLKEAVEKLKEKMLHLDQAAANERWHETAIWVLEMAELLMDCKRHLADIDKTHKRLLDKVFSEDTDPTEGHSKEPKND